MEHSPALQTLPKALGDLPTLPPCTPLPQMTGLLPRLPSLVPKSCGAVVGTLAWFWFHFCNLTKEVAELKKKKNLEKQGSKGADLTLGE